MVASNKTQNNDVVPFTLVVVNSLNPHPSDGIIMLLKLPSYFIFDAHELSSVQRQDGDLIGAVVLLHQVDHKSYDNIGLFWISL